MDGYVYHTDLHAPEWTAGERLAIWQERERLITAAHEASEVQDSWHNVECGNRACVSTCDTRSRWVDAADKAVTDHERRYPHFAIAK